MGVLDTLAAATPVRRSVVMCVDGALQAQWDAANERLDDAARADTDQGSLAMPALTKAVNELDDLREKVAASQVTFLFERMPWTKRIALQAEHPPRNGNIADRLRGYNLETFPRALIKASCISVTGADGDQVTSIPAETWDGLLGTEETAGSLNLKQVDRLTQAATHVNDGENAVPPSARSLLGSQDSGASLAQPVPGTSPRGASAAGNRRGSRKSSTSKKASTPAGSVAT